MHKRNYDENESLYIRYTGQDGLMHFTSEEEIEAYFSRDNLDPHWEMEAWEVEELADVARAALDNFRYDEQKRRGK